MFSKAMIISNFEEEIDTNQAHFEEVEFACLKFCLQKYHCILL